MTRQRLLVALNGATALAAIAALTTVLTLAPRFSSIERHVREVHQVIVTLKLPRGVHAQCMQLACSIIGKEVMPGPPGHPHAPGGKPAPA